MQNFETLWRFNTKRFSIDLSCAEEYAPNLSWGDTGEVREKLATGEYVCVCFRVRVLLDGSEIASDYLGESIYADVRDFRREHVGLAALRRKDGKNYGCYFSGMVASCVKDARAAVSARPRLRA